MKITKRPPRKLRNVLKIADDENAENDAPVEKTAEEIELEELEEMDREIAELKDEERRKEKRKKKKAKVAQAKLIEKLNLKMIIPGDEGPRAVDDEVFKVSTTRTVFCKLRIINKFP